MNSSGNTPERPIIIGDGGRPSTSAQNLSNSGLDFSAPISQDTILSPEVLSRLVNFEYTAQLAHFSFRSPANSVHWPATTAIYPNDYSPRPDARIQSPSAASYGSVNALDSDYENADGDDDITYLGGRKRQLASINRISRKRQCQRAVHELRNQCLKFNQIEKHAHAISNFIVRKGDTVQLSDMTTYLQIDLIYEDFPSGDVFLRGHQFSSTGSMAEFPKNIINEVCWTMDVDLDDPRKHHIQSRVTIPETQVFGPCSIKFTNKSFFAEEINDLPSSGLRGPILTCRTKIVTLFHNADARSKRLKDSRSILFLRNNELRSMCVVKDTTSRLAWRGCTLKGGTQKGWLQGEQEFLHQESICNLGIPCVASLQTSRTKYHETEAMKRGPVGHLAEPTPSNVGSSSSLLSYLPLTPRQHIGRPGVESGYWPAISCDFQEYIDFQDDDLVQISSEAFHQKAVSKSEAVVMKGMELNTGIIRTLGPRTGHILPPKPELPPSGRRYSFADCFCGGGGMSRAAVDAGLSVKWAFDNDPDACDTYALNNFGTRVHCLSVSEICDPQFKADLKVDIMHISTPCQFWSPAHTTPGKDDAANRATLFTIGGLLDRGRPRVVILEQTRGLESHHNDQFKIAMCQLVERSFSIRHSMLTCADFGVAQQRTRLFVIAAW